MSDIAKGDLVVVYRNLGLEKYDRYIGLFAEVTSNPFKTVFGSCVTLKGVSVLIWFRLDEIKKIEPLSDKELFLERIRIQNEQMQPTFKKGVKHGTRN